MNAYIQRVIDDVKKKNASQPEFCQTVEEVLEEVTTEEPVKDEKDLRIEELEGLLKDRDAVIEELTAKIKELEDKLNAPVEEAVEVKASAQCKSNNNFNKYFN